MVAQDRRLASVELVAGSRMQTIQVVGYADDVALYLASADEISAALESLATFERASGL